MEDKIPPITDKLNAALLVKIHNNIIDLNEKIEEMRLKEIRERSTYRDTNRYDVHHTITKATPNDPNDFDSLVYDRESIFEVLGMINAPRIEVVNDGTDNLYVRVSHGGNSTYSHEGLIRPGDVKRYKDVYELRLRSPTLGLPYRVTEYDLDSSPSVVNTRALTCDDKIDVCDRCNRLLGQLCFDGVPIDPRTRRWDLNFATDQVDVTGSAVTVTNLPQTPIIDYTSVTGIGPNSSAIHNYVTTANFRLSNIEVSASGAVKIEVKTGNINSETTKLVAFTTPSNLTAQLRFHEELSLTVGQRLQVIITNRELQSMDIYSTIMGFNI